MKAPKVQSFLDNMSERITSQPVGAGKCRTCGVEINPQGFTDYMSLIEYRISGMCQRCQDAVFCEPEDEEGE